MFTSSPPSPCLFALGVFFSITFRVSHLHSLASRSVSWPLVFALRGKLDYKASPGSQSLHRCLFPFLKKCLFNACEHAAGAPFLTFSSRFAITDKNDESSSSLNHFLSHTPSAFISFSTAVKPQWSKLTFLQSETSTKSKEGKEQDLPCHY